MNRNLLFTLILWVMAAFVPAMAQNTLTVYDGDEGNAYVPVYGYYCDAYLKCEFVIPADDLADMNGNAINEITWYLKTKPGKAWSDNFQVFMMEVEDATISDFYGPENATVVYVGTFDASGENFTLVLNEPYVYNGGNLLIGVYQTDKGAYSMSSFYGMTVNGASVQGNSYSSLEAVTASQRNFIPKTTFSYAPASATVYPKPKNLNASNIGPNEATLTWEAGSTETEWNVEYKKATDEEWTSAGVANTTTFVLDALANGYDYEARVQAKFDDGTSNWVKTTFSTPLCDEEDQGEISYVLGDKYADSWNNAYIQVISATTGSVVGTITMASGSTTVTGTFPLCYGETYNFVWVSGSYDGECSFTITDPDGNVLASHDQGDDFIGFDLFTYTMTMPETGIEELYLVGTFNGWSQVDGMVAFTENEGEFTATITLEADAEFKVITPAGEGEWQWFGGEDANGVGYFLINNDMLNGEIALVDGANFRVEEAGEYSFTIKEAGSKGINEPLEMIVTKTNTGITTISADQNNNDWYNINGQKLSGKPTAPGFYINGNKKVVIK
ncbi:MAG: fibronectin type III domain-containing protein [Muribaculaceae bacterium]|nr:fibronectin type III domain-containing protein [Muribaculaceae bacterium]